MKILAVDDDPQFLFVMKMMLKKYVKNHQLELITYTHPEKALQEIDKVKPDLIFLDLFMPNISGWDFLNEIDYETSNFLVYILSSSVDRNDRDKANSYSIVKDFISKPLSFSRLESIIISKN